MPTSVGSSLRSWLKASSPPAEAPMPTIGNVSDGSEGDRSEGRSACGGLGVAASCTRPDERLGADFLCGAFRAISGSSSDPHEATRRTASHDRRKDDHGQERAGGERHEVGRKPYRPSRNPKGPLPPSLFHSRKLHAASILL